MASGGHSAHAAHESPAIAAGFLDALFSQEDVGVGVWDTELRYTRVNAALAAMNGAAPEDHVGRRIPDMLPRLAEVESLLREVRDSGVAATGLEVSGETPAQPGIVRHWQASFYPLREGSGPVVGIGALIVDITEQKRAEAELARRERDASFLAEASAVLSSSLDAKRLLRSIARLAVPRIADWCVVDMLQDDGSMRRVALTHVDRSKEGLAWDLTRRYPSGPDAFEGTPKAIRSSFRELVPEVRDSFLRRMAQDDQHLAILRELGLKSLMIVPLNSGGRTLGAIGLVSAQSGRRFDRHDLALAENLAERCALAVENARLFEERNGIARTLARSLLPPRLPQIEGLEVAARYRPGTSGLAIGGDFYDVFETSDGRFAAVIGDVTGKGAHAAAITALARHTLHAAAGYERSPSGVLSALNDALRGDERRNSFLTAVYTSVVRNGSATRIELCVAGHPQPLVLRADGRVDFIGASGTLLGFDETPRLVDSPDLLAPGDTLVLYTDGVIEGRPDEVQLGEDGLAELLHRCRGLSSEELASRIMSEASSAEAGAASPRDDMALLLLRATG